MHLRHSTSTLLLLLALFLVAGCTTAPPKQESLGQAVSADGSPISYGTRGEGEPALVFIHCWTCNHRYWSKQIDYFAKTHQVIWLDLAGHGSSGSKRTDYTMEAFGADVAAVVEKVGPRKVVLIGHSMGGPVAVEAAKRLGDRVVGIVGVDVFYTAFQAPTDRAQIEAFIEPFKKDFRATTEGMVRSMFAPTTDQKVIESIVAQFAEPDQEMAISAMRSILDWQGHRAPIDLAHFAPILRNINGAPMGDEQPLHPSVTLIKNVGHFVAQVKPEEFNRVLDGIIAEF